MSISQIPKLKNNIFKYIFSYSFEMAIDKSFVIAIFIVILLSFISFESYFNNHIKILR